MTLNSRIHKTALALSAALLIALAASAQAQAECRTADDCFAAAEMQDVAGENYFNQGVFYRAAADQEFRRGNAAAASWYAAAADQKFREAQFTIAAADGNADRGLFFSALNENQSRAQPRGAGGDGRGGGWRYCRKHGGDRSFGCLAQDQLWSKVCDRDRDGHRTSIQFSAYGSVYELWEIWESGYDSAYGGCLVSRLSDFYIWRFRVCVEKEGCTAWKQP